MPSVGPCPLARTMYGLEKKKMLGVEEERMYRRKA